MVGGRVMDGRKRRGKFCNYYVLENKKETISASFILQITCLNIVNFPFLRIKSFVISFIFRETMYIFRNGGFCHKN